jgi:hypothetical protein
MPEPAPPPEGFASNIDDVVDFAGKLSAAVIGDGYEDPTVYVAYVSDGGIEEHDGFLDRGMRISTCMMKTPESAKSAFSKLYGAREREVALIITDKGGYDLAEWGEFLLEIGLIDPSTVVLAVAAYDIGDELGAVLAALPRFAYVAWSHGGVPARFGNDDLYFVMGKGAGTDKVLMSSTLIKSAGKRMERMLRYRAVLQLVRSLWGKGIIVSDETVPVHVSAIKKVVDMLSYGRLPFPLTSDDWDMILDDNDSNTYQAAIGYVESDAGIGDIDRTTNGLIAFAMAVDDLSLLWGSVLEDDPRAVVKHDPLSGDPVCMLLSNAHMRNTEGMRRGTAFADVVEMADEHGMGAAVAEYLGDSGADGE